ncbi:Exosome complex component RRP41 [Hondaea fermentalgiana]|uniref:Exosome complex component RRP41 n=1 Tax=Hondaea fermentalgiana TaxID=2315210 RepID=A0A2R5GQL7_9STRA|nr:Exosome complex component RRP41 [Hondaea fermentalgiana]|eukprot:GBG32609.1 Exosome complex component RRP41 [Hondaea fermentalgiana]
MEFVQLSGLRGDGRRGNEVRKLGCHFGAVVDCDGSAMLDQGLTKVLACVHGPREVAQRSARPGDRRSLAVANFVQDTFTQVIQTELFKGSQIDITIHILQADGGVLAACVNATTAALIHAGVPMVDFVTCCNVGYLDHTALLDLNHVEELAGGPELSLTLLPKSGKVLTMRMASSSVRVTEKLLQQLLDEAQAGCQLIHKVLDSKVRELVAVAVKKRHGADPDAEIADAPAYQ